eukprot:gene524-799_t
MYGAGVPSIEYDPEDVFENRVRLATLTFLSLTKVNTPVGPPVRVAMLRRPDIINGLTAAQQLDQVMTFATLLQADGSRGVVSCVGQAQNEHALYVVPGRKHLTLKQCIPLLPVDEGVNVLRQVLFGLCCVCMGADWSPHSKPTLSLVPAGQQGDIIYNQLLAADVDNLVDKPCMAKLKKCHDVVAMLLQPGISYCILDFGASLVENVASQQ